MDLTFRIIWFEDVDEWYNTTSRRGSKYIKDKNFKVEIKRIAKASDFLLKDYQIQNYDLLIVDYELEKVYGQDGVQTIYGTKIIQMIRKGKFLNDVLFYSSHGYDVINNIMKQEGLQGVFVADRDNGEFFDMVKLLIDKAIRRADNLINIRGVVMDTTSDFDNKIRDLISIIWHTLGDKENKVVDNVKKKILKDNICTAEKLSKKYSIIDSKNIDDLLNERDFSAHRQARLLGWCIESNEELKNKFLEIIEKHLQIDKANPHIRFFELYNDEIIKYRNALAHVKHTPSNGTQVFTCEIDGHSVVFDKELCNRLRKRLLDYDYVLDDLYDYIESNY